MFFFKKKKKDKVEQNKIPTTKKDLSIHDKQDDFQTSPAHLLLLSKFRNGDNPSRYYNDENWKNVLRENPETVFKKFLREGLLEQAGLFELIDHKYKASDLKSMLKEKGLKQSGSKKELIQRLIEHDENAMSEATKNIYLHQCTNTGMKLANNYLEEEEKKRESVENNVFDLLAKKQFSQAVLAVAQFESMQVFQRGMGIDWNNYDGSKEIEGLKSIFITTPSILQDIDKNAIDQLRIATAMMYLWGVNTAQKWLPKDLDAGIHLDSEVACRMFLFHARHLNNITTYKNAIKEGVMFKSFQISTANDSCPECQKIARRKYRSLDDVPELPYSKCTYKKGCRCVMTANVGV